MNQDKVTASLELTQAQLDWLRAQARDHELPDASKALRCLVSFAMSRGDLESEIFDVIRCARPEDCENST